jgi:REP element-mobilizing transposase RayT
MTPPRRAILASHLIFTGYGHWLSNDPRGSGSTETRKDDLRELGAIHAGRKRVQPPRDEVRAFYREATERLDHDVLWFDDAMRLTIADAVKQACGELGYTLHAFCVCSNHMHALARPHRDRAEAMMLNLVKASRAALRESSLVPPLHPVWSARPYKVFKHTPQQVRVCVDYIFNNPMKEGLPVQRWDFVRPYPYAG